MYLNFNNPKIGLQIEELMPTPGVCIFIDICDSTVIKQGDFKKWVIQIGNTIRICSNFLPGLANNVIKLIGDEVMFYIPDKKISEQNENYLTILYALQGIMGKFNTSLDNLFLPTKASIHYCADTYNINYRDDSDDYYGNGVDFTARLMCKSSEGKIVMSEDFFEKIIQIDPAFNASEQMSESFKGLGHKLYRVVSV